MKNIFASAGGLFCLFFYGMIVGAAVFAKVDATKKPVPATATKADLCKCGIACDCCDPNGEK